MRKLICFGVIATFFIILTISNLLASAADVGTIEVTIADIDGNPITETVVGDVIRVSVYLSDFPMLTMTNPSLHFNPSVVNVSNQSGQILPTRFGNRSAFQLGDALTWSGWGGTAMVNFLPRFLIMKPE